MKKSLKFSDLPFYKKIPETKIIVDYYKTDVEGVESTILTHFHADHYFGLKKSFGKKIFCTKTTENLVSKFIGVKSEFLHPLELYKFYNIENCVVYPIDANHCPGAACFVLIVGEKIYFHCGDFRFDEEIHLNFFEKMKENFVLQFENKLFKIKDSFNYDAVYLDNTYENKNDFLPQKEIVCSIIKELKTHIVKTNVLAEPKIKMVFPSYLIGKEKLVLSVAEYFDEFVYVNKRKQDIINCFCEETVDILNRNVNEIVDYCKEILGEYKKRTYIFKTKKAEPLSVKTPFERFSNSFVDAKIDVISSAHKNRNKINLMYKEKRYEKIIVVYGSGWNNKVDYWRYDREDKKINKGIVVYYVPYSEHSSSLEIERFKENIVKENIIRTVNHKK